MISCKAKMMCSILAMDSQNTSQELMLGELHVKGVSAAFDRLTRRLQVWESLKISPTFHQCNLTRMGALFLPFGTPGQAFFPSFSWHKDF